jgi:MinD-like ATPase involved in chromosome partitioning or flagellar assembly
VNALPVVVWGERESLVTDLERSASRLVVVRQSEDLAEVLAVIGSGIASHAVLAGPTSEITAAFAEALTRAGGRGVCLVARSDDEPRLSRLGLHPLSWEATPETIEAALVSGGPGADPVLSHDGGPVPPPGSVPQRGAWAPAPEPFPDPVPVPPPARTGRATHGEAPPSGRGDTPGTITVVWGPHGAPGRSTLALNLAVEEALTGSRVCLVDADTQAACLGPMLGLMDETAGLVRLTRSVQDGDFDPGPDTAAHARVRVDSATLRFTSGLPRPQRWAEVSAEGLRGALAALAATCDHVIVDVAAEAGQDEDLALDTFAPQRNDATITALSLAHRVLVLGTADAVGLPRLMRACEEIPTRVGPEARTVVVVNKLRAGSSGPRPEAAVVSAWRRFGPRDAVPSHFLPWDQAAADAALLAGKALAEVAPRSGLRKAIGGLTLGATGTEAVIDRTGAGARGRRRARTRQHVRGDRR